MDTVILLLCGASTVLGVLNAKSIASLREHLVGLVTGVVRQEGPPAAQATAHRARQATPHKAAPLNL